MKYILPVLVFFLGFTHYVTELVTLWLRFSFANTQARAEQFCNDDIGLYWFQASVNIFCAICYFIWYRNMKGVTPKVIELNFEMPAPLCIATYAIYMMLVLIFVIKAEGCSSSVAQFLIDLCGYGFQIGLHLAVPWTIDQKQEEINRISGIFSLSARLKAHNMYQYKFSFLLTFFQGVLGVLQLFFTVSILYIDMKDELMSNSLTIMYLLAAVESVMVIEIVQIAVQKWRHLYRSSDEFTISAWKFYSLSGMERHFLRRRDEFTDFRREKTEVIVSLFRILERIEISRNWDSQKTGEGLKCSQQFILEVHKFCDDKKMAVVSSWPEVLRSLYPTLPLTPLDNFINN